jgi:hypothetical protein
VASIADLRPGMLGFGPIDGAARWPVWLAELLLGEGFTVGPLKIEHVFVVTSVTPSLVPLNESWPVAYRPPIVTAVEAMPSGARAVSIVDRWTPEYAYVMLPEDYPGQGEDAAAIARAMIGTPYSPLSYAALSAWRLDMLKGKELPDGTIEPSRLEAWIDRRKPDQMIPELTRIPGGRAGYRALPMEAICSVLADQAWALTGKQVMPKGTPHQCVTPGALGAALLEMPGAQWLWPGR